MGNDSYKPTIYSTSKNTSLAEKFTQARKVSRPNSPPVLLYLALLAYRLSAEEARQLIAYLRLPGVSAQTLRDNVAIKSKIEELSTHGLAPSRIYSLLQGYSLSALTASSLAIDITIAAEHIELYINVLRHVQPTLNGEDIKRLGIPAGPRIKGILQLLRGAKLDGKVRSRKEEEEMVMGIIKG